MYRCTKTYGHDVGLSAVFRQWRAESHCQYLHGYALSVKLVFEADTLDSRNWVLDFGALKPVKEWLQEAFDHMLIIAEDDPNRLLLEGLGRSGLAQTRIVPAVGCEAFAEQICVVVDSYLRGRYCPNLFRSRNVTPPVNLRIVEVTVSEHGANSATFINN